MDWEMSTWHKDIGKHTGRTAEDVVFKLYALVDGNVVLDANAITDFDVITDIHILPKRAVLANDGTALHMAEMPNLGAFTYRDIVIDIAGWMNCIHILFKLRMVVFFTLEYILVQEDSPSTYFRYFFVFFTPFVLVQV